MVYNMLVSSSEEAEMAMIIIKNHYGKNIPKKILRIYNFYKLLRNRTYETWSFKGGRVTKMIKAKNDPKYPRGSYFIPEPN